MSATDRKCQCGSRHLTMLTAMLLLLHTRTGTAVTSDMVGAIQGHRGQKRITGWNRRHGVVSHQLFHFTGPGASIGVAAVRGNLVEGDGAVVEVQCGWRGIRSRAVLIALWGAVTEHRLLFNSPGHQFWRADRWGWHYCETMSPGLDLQLLGELTNKKHDVDDTRQIGK